MLIIEQSPEEDPGCTSTTPFLMERRSVEGNKKKNSYFSLRSQDGKHSFEDFVSS